MSNLNKLIADFAQESEFKEPPMLPPPPPLVPEAPTVAPGTSTSLTEADETEEKEPVSDEEIESNSEMVLAFLDVGQNKAFDYLLEKKKDKKITGLYGTNAKKQLENAIAKQDKAAANLNDDDLGLLKIEEKVNGILKTFPLTPDEKDILRPHIKKMIKKNAGEIPDGFWAACAVFGVFGGRLMNVMQL